MNDKTVTDYDIQALVDNELGWKEENRVRRFVRSDPRLQRRYEELKAQKSLLHTWWKDRRLKS